MHFNTITTSQLDKVFHSLPPKNSAGIDGTLNKILKHCQKEISLPILDVINTVYFSSRNQKEIVYYPKFKKGNELSIGNYRPIYILPTLSKYLEKVINRQLTEYLVEKHSLLSKNQHGFIKGKNH